VTSNKKFRTPEDTEGIKIRVMGSPMLIEAYNTYGFDAITLDYGEIYSALQMNLLDAQVQPMFANYSMGFYEQVDYITNMEAEMFTSLPLANKEFFDSLPQEIQDKILEIWADLMVPAGEDSLVREQKFIDMVQEKKPDIEFYRFTDEDIAPFRELSRSLHDKYLEIGGDGAEKILETLLADLEKAKEKYGVN
jgi:TRAP-type C4-dicarboxylate transport system substrate-binding protein